MDLIFMNYFDKNEMSICNVIGNVIKAIIFTFRIMRFLFSSTASVKRWGWILPQFPVSLSDWHLQQDHSL